MTKTQTRKISGKEKLGNLLDSYDFGEKILISSVIRKTGLSYKSIAMHLSWWEAGLIRGKYIIR